MRCLFQSEECWGITEKHHVIPRAHGGHKLGEIPACTYHHQLCTDHKIKNNEIVQKANEYFGYERYYLPHPESKHIKVRSDV
jgi:hypothetical protein